MKRLLYAFAVAIFAALFCLSQAARAQGTASIQTGFAVVTPLLGGGQGVSVSETLSHLDEGNLFQASVLSSPLVTFTNVFVSLDANVGADTGIAIVNSSVTPAAITLMLRNQEGVTVAIRTVTLGGRQQLSRFVTQLFRGVRELASPFAGLLFISSNAPVGVLGLEFIGPSFTSLPVATQLPPNGIATLDTGTNAFGPPGTTVGPSTFVFNSPSIPVSLPTQPVTEEAAPLVTVTGQSTPATSIRAAAATGSVLTSPGTGTSATGLHLLPQVVTGGGWSSRIMIANTSTVPQLVRVDFFNSAGEPLLLPLSANAPILVPARGVATVSTVK